MPLDPTLMVGLPLMIRLPPPVERAAVPLLALRIIAEDVVLEVVTSPDTVRLPLTVSTSTVPVVVVIPFVAPTVPIISATLL